MPTITVETFIDVPIETCFDLARDIGLHCQTLAHTRERAVAGVTSGLIGPGQSVTFEGVHFGIRQRLSARIIEFQRPYRFVDEMTRGAFRSLQHIHEFTPHGAGTLMRDILVWQAPCGVLGSAANVLFLQRYMKALITRRNLQLKRVAEGENDASQMCK